MNKNYFYLLALPLLVVACKPSNPLIGEWNYASIAIRDSAGTGLDSNSQALFQMIDAVMQGSGYKFRDDGTYTQYTSKGEDKGTFTLDEEGKVLTLTAADVERKFKVMEMTDTSLALGSSQMTSVVVRYRPSKK